MRQTFHKRIFTFLATLILLSSSILAFAVSSQYYEGNPLYLQPGEIREVKIMLQNHAGTEDVNVKAEIIEGQNIIQLNEPNDIFLVPKGEKIDVYFKINIPQDAKKGDIFPVTIMFASTTTSTGSIGLSGSIGKGFNVVIGNPRDFDENGNLKTNLSWMVYLIIPLIIAITIIGAVAFYLRKNRKISKK